MKEETERVTRSMVAQYYDRVELENAIKDFQDKADKAEKDRDTYLEWKGVYEKELASRDVAPEAEDLTGKKVLILTETSRFKGLYGVVTKVSPSDSFPFEVKLDVHDEGVVPFKREEFRVMRSGFSGPQELKDDGPITFEINKT